jgi:hypothetical protein
MTTKRLFLISLALTLALVPAVAQAQDDLGALRAATARFHRVAEAEGAGYGQFLGCISQPGQGAMGIHFVNGALAGDAALDPLRPEALVYEPDESGKLKLVALEFIVFQAAWDSENSASPSLFGRPFRLVPSPNRFGVPPFYELHVWAWRHNSAGLFADWNPEVTCP